MVNDTAGTDADTAKDTAIELVVVTSDTAIAFVVGFFPTVDSVDTAVDFVLVGSKDFVVVVNFFVVASNDVGYKAVGGASAVVVLVVLLSSQLDSRGNKAGIVVVIDFVVVVKFFLIGSNDVESNDVGSNDVVSKAVDLDLPRRTDMHLILLEERVAASSFPLDFLLLIRLEEQVGGGGGGGCFCFAAGADAVASAVAGGCCCSPILSSNRPHLSTNCGTARHDVSLLFAYFQSG